MYAIKALKKADIIARNEVTFHNTNIRDVYKIKGGFTIMRTKNIRMCKSWQTSVPYQIIRVFSNT